MIFQSYDLDSLPPLHRAAGTGDVDELARLLDPGQTHPMDAKKTLAADIVKFYHGPETAQHSRAEWEKRFSGRQDPTDIPQVTVARESLVDGGLPLFKLLVALQMAKSGNDARRLVEGGGVTLGPDRQKLTDPNAAVPIADGLIVRVGNRRIAAVRLT